MNVHWGHDGVLRNVWIQVVATTVAHNISLTPLRKFGIARCTRLRAGHRARLDDRCRCISDDVTPSGILPDILSLSEPSHLDGRGWCFPRCPWDQRPMPRGRNNIARTFLLCCRPRSVWSTGTRLRPQKASRGFHIHQQTFLLLGRAVPVTRGGEKTANERLRGDSDSLLM